MRSSKHVYWSGAFNLVLVLAMVGMAAGCKKGTDSSSSSSKASSAEGGLDPKMVDIHQQVADYFLKKLTQGKVRDTYEDNTSAGFKKKYSLEQFQLMIDQHPGLTQLPRKIIINRQNGGKLELINSQTATIDFAEEDGVWKIKDLTFP